MLPLLFCEDRLTCSTECFTLDQIRDHGAAPIRSLIAEHEARRRDPGFRPVFGNPEFDAEVRRIRDRLAAAPALHVPDPFADEAVVLWAGGASPVERYEQAQEEQVRLADAAWPQLREVMRLWRPVCEDHLGPVVLFADPILAQVITPERGRELLSLPRG